MDGRTVLINAMDGDNSAAVIADQRTTLFQQFFTPLERSAGNHFLNKYWDVQRRIEDAFGRGRIHWFTHAYQNEMNDLVFERARIIRYIELIIDRFMCHEIKEARKVRDGEREHTPHEKVAKRLFELDYPRYYSELTTLNLQRYLWVLIEEQLKIDIEKRGMALVVRCQKFLSTASLVMRLRALK